MATPRGAEHRDLEQRFRNLERKCADLANRVLMQRKLEVTQGDFVVSGGGNVIVQDGGDVVVGAGGTLSSQYAAGQLGMRFGPSLSQAPDGQGLEIFDPSGALRIWIGRRNDGAFTASFDATQMDLSATTLNLTGNLTQSGPINAAGSSATFAHSQVFVGHPTDQQVFIRHATTSNAANARIESNGLIMRSTSSRRYKQDIDSAVIDPDRVLSLEPRTWRDRAEVEADPDTQRRHVGFIAEELDGAGLGMFVEYDDEGRPEAIQYDRLPAALLAVVKRQQEQIAELSAAVADLSARVG